MRGGRVAAALAALAMVPACGGAAEPVEDPDPPTVGLLRLVPDEDHGAFVDELRRQGWRVGEDVDLVPADQGELYADVDEARTAVEGWLRDDLDLVVAFSTPFAQLVSGLDPGVPGLFVVNDPEAAGLVGDVLRPDGTMTGVTFRTPADRLLALASETLGGITRAGYLYPSDDPAVPGHRRAFVEAAADLGIDVVERAFAEPSEVAAGVAEIADAGVQVVAVPSTNATVRALDELRSAVDEQGLPLIGNTDLLDFAVLVLTPDGAVLRRQLARQVVRILEGADVSNVPVEDPRKFTLIVNRSKVRELGLPPVPDAVLRQADVVR